MSRTQLNHLGLIGSLLATLGMQVACLGEESVRGGAVAMDRTTHPLTAGQLASVNGTYGGACRNRAGSWSVAIAVGATLDNPPLSVILNDVACVLTLVSLHTDTGIMSASPAIALTASYKPAASAFGAPVEFYANARLSSVTFAADFVIEIPFADDPALATADNTAAFVVVVATATAQGVAAPDYTLDVSGLSVMTDVNDIVQTATGTATLTAGAVTGQSYVVAAASGLITYAAIEAAFQAGTSAAITPTIPAAAFTLAGVDLTANVARTLIIANTQSGMSSYQAIEITFHPAP